MPFVTIKNVIQANLFQLCVFIYFPSSMQVMMQPQNRDMSFSLYISSLAVSDTIAMLIGKSELYSKGYIYTFIQTRIQTAFALH